MYKDTGAIDAASNLFTLDDYVAVSPPTRTKVRLPGDKAGESWLFPRKENLFAGRQVFGAGEFFNNRWPSRDSARVNGLGDQRYSRDTVWIQTT